MYMLLVGSISVTVVGFMALCISGTWLTNASAPPLHAALRPLLPSGKAIFRRESSLACGFLRVLCVEVAPGRNFKCWSKSISASVVCWFSALPIELCALAQRPYAPCNVFRDCRGSWEKTKNIYI